MAGRGLGRSCRSWWQDLGFYPWEVGVLQGCDWRRNRTRLGCSRAPSGGCFGGGQAVGYQSRGTGL